MTATWRLLIDDGPGFDTARDLPVHGACGGSDRGRDDQAQRCNQSSSTRHIMSLLVRWDGHVPEFLQRAEYRKPQSEVNAASSGPLQVLVTGITSSRSVS